MNLQKIGKVLTSKSVGTGPSSYEKRIYRAAVSQRLRNTDLGSVNKRKISCPLPGVKPLFIIRQPHSSVTTRSLSLTSPAASTVIADVKVLQLLAAHTQQNTHVPSYLLHTHNRTLTYPATCCTHATEHSRTQRRNRRQSGRAVPRSANL